MWILPNGHVLHHYRELPVEGVPTKEVAPVEWLATEGAMLPDPKGMANPVPRDANYPILIIVGRVRDRGLRVP